MSCLKIIATPIGNRQDISLRALQELFSLDYLLCEDTRNTKQLLNFYQQKIKSLSFDEWLNVEMTQIPQLVSYFEHNEEARIPQVLSLLINGQKVGLVSNAGTPTISDPGFKLVKACLENQIKVISVPGASALISALSISGLSSDKFTFLGFLPRKAGKQNKIWQDLANSQLKQTIIFYESAFRLRKTLQNLSLVYGDIEVMIVREITKLHEETQKYKISKWLEILQKPLKGELVALFRVGDK